MTDNGKQAATQPAGFWKIRHAVMGLGALLLVIVLVRSCGGDGVDETVEAEPDDAVPRHAIAVKIPQQPEPPWQGQYPSPQQPYQAPAFPQQQQPSFGGYPPPQQQPGHGYSTQQQRPGYGYSVQQPQQQPAYGYPAQQQQPAYGYPAQQLPPQGQAPAAHSGNPWAVQRQPYGYGAPPQWGETQRQPLVYSQPPGSGQYRPLDERPQSAQQRRSETPATGWTTAPYDRPAGSSFGGNAATGYPYAGGYPGHYGGAPYGVPGYGAGWSGGLGYPGAGWPGVW